MLLPEEYISLESAIASLRREAPEVLKAIAMAVNSVSPSTQFTRSTINGSEYGKTVQGFAITYGQLGAYLNLAVNKYASVLIETEVGVLQSQHVKVNREWLLAQREQAAQLPEVARAAVFKTSGAHGATVTPIFSPLIDQTPDIARSELRKLKIRIEKHLALPADDLRDREIEQLQMLVYTSHTEKMAAIEECAALARTVKTLTLENDQLRKARIEKPVPTNFILLQESNSAQRVLSNVEIRNAAIQKARETVCEIAKGLWAHSDLAGCRTGKMAQIVRRSVEQELLKLLPKTDIALGRWLTADAAPPSAKRKGRPSKSDPNK